jgi:hypothetical protein
MERASESRFYRFRREPLSFLPVTATAPPGNRRMVTEAMLRRVTALPRATRAGLCLTEIETLPPDVDAPPVDVEVLFPVVVASVAARVAVLLAVDVPPALRRRGFRLRQLFA